MVALAAVADQCTTWFEAAWARLGYRPGSGLGILCATTGLAVTTTGTRREPCETRLPAAAERLPPGLRAAMGSSVCGCGDKVRRTTGGVACLKLLVGEQATLEDGGGDAAREMDPGDCVAGTVMDAPLSTETMGVPRHGVTGENARTVCPGCGSVIGDVTARIVTVVGGIWTGKLTAEAIPEGGPAWLWMSDML